jgi:hypothetical protein
MIGFNSRLVTGNRNALLSSINLVRSRFDFNAHQFGHYSSKGAEKRASEQVQRSGKFIRYQEMFQASKINMGVVYALMASLTVFSVFVQKGYFGMFWL